jgi:predicted dinucleotide-binding enzyme
VKVAVLGTGVVGKTLAGAFRTLGHEVKVGSRSAKDDVLAYADAAAWGEIVVLSTLGLVVEEVVKACGAALDGKIVIDTTNPLDTSAGFPPKLAWPGDSAGERVQRAAPKAHVVKAFNIVGNADMFEPELPGGPPDMFFAGNDRFAKEKVAALLRDFGWNAVDIGGIDQSRQLESLCILWVVACKASGTWRAAFKLLRKPA